MDHRIDHSWNIIVDIHTRTKETRLIYFRISFLALTYWFHLNLIGSLYLKSSDFFQQNHTFVFNVRSIINKWMKFQNSMSIIALCRCVLIFLSEWSIFLHIFHCVNNVNTALIFSKKTFNHEVTWPTYTLTLSVSVSHQIHEIICADFRSIIIDFRTGKTTNLIISEIFCCFK